MNTHYRRFHPLLLLTGCAAPGGTDSGPRADNVALLVDEAAGSVVRQLKRAGLLAR